MPCFVSYQVSDNFSAATIGSGYTLFLQYIRRTKICIYSCSGIHKYVQASVGLDREAQLMKRLSKEIRSQSVLNERDKSRKDTGRGFTFSYVEVDKGITAID